MQQEGEARAEHSKLCWKADFCQTVIVGMKKEGLYGLKSQSFYFIALRGGAGGVPGRPDRLGRPPPARGPDHRDQRDGHDRGHPCAGQCAEMSKDLSVPA